jgi:WD40 repeat protein
MAQLRFIPIACLLLLQVTAGHAAAPTLFMIGGASSVSIFDPTTLTEQSYVAAPGPTSSGALSPDGTTAYIASGGSVLVVNATTHHISRRLPSDNATVIRLSPDGSRLYAANVNGSVWVYDTASGFVVHRLSFLVKDFFYYAVAGLTVSSDGMMVALGSLESLCGEFGCPAGDPPALITEINGQTGALIRRVPVAYLTSLAISEDNSSVYLATGSAIVQANAVTGLTTATIPFATNQVTLDAGAGRLYGGTVNNPYTLGVFSTANNSPIATVPLTGPVAALAYSPDHTTVFAGGCVGNPGSNAFPCPVAAVATGNWQVVATGTLAGSPADLAVSSSTSQLWVANASPIELTAVNTATNRISGEAEADYSPFTMTVTPIGDKVYTANTDGTISVIDGTNLSREKVLSVGPQSFNEVGNDCVSPDGTRAYIALNKLQVIDTSIDQVTGTIAELPFGCVVSPDSTTVYTYNGAYDETSNEYRLTVTSYSASNLAQLKAQSFLSGQLPFGLFVSPDGSVLYLTTAFSATTFSTPTLQIGNALKLDLCIAAALSPDGTTLYCLDQPEDTAQPDQVEEISTATGTVKQTYSAGAWAFGNVALTPDGTNLYLSLETAGSDISGLLEELNVTTGALRFVNTTLFGALAIR